MSRATEPAPGGDPEPADEHDRRVEDTPDPRETLDPVTRESLGDDLADRVERVLFTFAATADAARRDRVDPRELLGADSELLSELRAIRRDAPPAAWEIVLTRGKAFGYSRSYLKSLTRKAPREEMKHEAGSGALPDDFEGFASELWFARRLVAEHGADVRYVQAWGKWLAYDPPTGRWIEDEGAVWRAAKATARALLVEAQERLGNAATQEDIKAAQAWVAAGKRYFARAPLGNAIALAASEPEVQASPDQWDRDPYLLAVGAGQAVELRTGEARPATRTDYLTRGTAVEFDPEAGAPTWTKFLARVLPDPEIREFVKRLAGYSAVGEIREHLLLIFWGVGANGKSTYLGALRLVLGEYACGAPVSLLLEARGERHPTELALLFRRRLVVCAEAPEGGRLSEERVKAITGGDPIPCRRMREDFWEYMPTHKIVLVTNYKPRILGTDLGIWRRIQLVPWTVTIPEEEWDLALATKLREEAGGILAWVVAGAVEYLRDGLRPPKAVQVATCDYRQGEDVLGEFLQEHVVESSMAFLASKPLHARFLEWAAEQGITQPWGQKTLTRKLKDRGWKYSTSPRGWPGMSLQPPRSDRGIPYESQAESSRRDSYRNPRSDRGDPPPAEGWVL
ncbi:MAG: hypothetical protein HY720_02290 [Planctomycetes bacterium]|nr:hypothetical protein [Planctomycetota bacterium]